MADHKDHKEFDIENLGDELIERALPVKDFVEKHTRTMIFVGGGIVAVLLAFFGYRYYINGRNDEAKNEIYKLQLMFERDSFNIVLNGRQEQGAIVGIKSANEIIDEYSGTKQANLARFYAGAACLKTGKFDEAIEYLSKFDGDDDIIGAEALGMIGDAYVEKGPDNYNEALKYYEKAASHHSNSFTTPMYLMKAGRVYEEQKEYKKAMNCYERIKKDFPKAAEARDIDKYVERARVEAGEEKTN